MKISRNPNTSSNAQLLPLHRWPDHKTLPLHEFLPENQSSTKRKENADMFKWVKKNAPVFGLVALAQVHETLAFGPHTPFRLPMSYRPRHSKHRQTLRLLLSSWAEPPPLAYIAGWNNLSLPKQPNNKRRVQTNAATQELVVPARWGDMLVAVLGMTARRASLSPLPLLPAPASPSSLSSMRVHFVAPGACFILRTSRAFPCRLSDEFPGCRCSLSRP
jgi:hypothetical protein